MDAPPTLHGLGVLVTRPKHQADTLCRLIEDHGGIAIRWPTLVIAAPRDPAPALALFDRLAAYDLAIFTSANAVEWALPAIRERGGIPDRLDIAAIGQASGRALARHGIDRCLQPGDDFSSEGLLALPRLREVAGQRIAIVCGEGGRELLVETLSARGAWVDRAEVYRRERPAPANIEGLLARWKRGEIGAVTVTSGENLRNLFDMLGVAGQDYLCDTPLIVVSDRIRRIATEYGCRRLLLARDAGDDAIVAALLDLTTNSLSPAR